jgi:alcohol dehydrogenase class IV
MTQNFSLIPGSVNLRFGAGSLDQLVEAIEALGKKSAFIITDQGVAKAGVLRKITDILDAAGIVHGEFADIKPNPTVDLINTAAKAGSEFHDGVIIALGGGSSLDASKGVALVIANPTYSSSYFDYTRTPAHPALPIIAIPTTAGTGSETNNWGVIDDPIRQCKFYVGDASTTPAVAILDPLLTLTLPARPTAGTGIDAMTHAIESLTSKGRTPISAAYAHEAIRLINGSLVTAVKNGADVQARGDMLLGAHLAGLALTLSGLGLVHGIAHSVSAHVGAAHGEALAAVLPEVMTFNSKVAADVYASVAVDLGELASANATTAIDRIRGLADDINIRFPLSSFGVTQAMISDISSKVVVDSVTSNNPIMPTIEEVTLILTGRL